MQIPNKQVKKVILKPTKTKKWVGEIKEKIKTCENCKDKLEAKKCIVDAINKL